MNFKKSHNMKSFFENCHGPVEFTFEEKLEWVEHLNLEIQYYKALKRLTNQLNAPFQERAIVELEKQIYLLSKYLPELRKGGLNR